jgi:hypothetical protein
MRNLNKNIIVEGSQVIDAKLLIKDDKKYLKVISEENSNINWNKILTE